MKSVILMLTTVFSASIAQAETADESTGAFEGAFVSVNLGVQSRSSVDTHVQTSAQPGPAFDQPNVVGKGGILQVHGGYGHDLGSRFNVTIGGFVELTDGDFDVSRAAYFGDPVGQKIGNRMALYIAPGVYFGHQTLVYGKFGVSQAEHHYDRPTYAVSLGERVSGQLLGLGIKQKLNERIFWTLDYTRTDYGRSSLGTGVPLNGFTVDVRARAITEEVTIGFGYQF